MIHYLANGDAKDTLSNVIIYGESRPMDVMVDDVKEDSYLFDAFPDELVEKMQREDLLLHAHDWVIKTNKYAESQLLRDFFKIIATDD